MFFQINNPDASVGVVDFQYGQKLKDVKTLYWTN